MDDTQKQQQLQQTSGQTIFSNVQNPQPQMPPTPTPQGGGTGVHKEAEPMPSIVKPAEFITPTEQPVELEPEVEQAGVKEVPLAPKVSESAKAVGVNVSQAATPVQQAPTGFVKLPITKEEAEAKTKGNFLFKNPSESLLWLAMLIIRQFQMKQKEQRQQA